MGTVHAQTTIDASPEAVWAVLSDVGTWDQWNDVMVNGRCDGGQGAKISCKVAVGPIWFPVTSKAHTWTDNQALIWGQDVGRIVRINHGFRLRAEGEGTHIEHFESFEGAIGRLVFPLINGTLTHNYAIFLDALKARVEG